MKKVLAILGVLVLAPATSGVQAAGPNRVIAPDVPTEIEVPDGHVPFLVAHAVGTQGYFCLSFGASSVWVPFGPQATLFDEESGQVMTHFLSPNPDQGSALRAGQAPGEFGWLNRFLTGENWPS